MQGSEKMYLKKLVSVILMWSITISFFACLQPCKVSAQNFEFPYVYGKGEWSADCHGIRVYIAKGNDYERYKSNKDNKNYCIDILKCIPQINNIEMNVINGNVSNDKNFNVDYVAWSGDTIPDKIYVYSNFTAFFLINQNDSSTGYDEYGRDAMTVNNDICNIILKDYSSGDNPKDIEDKIIGIKNIWRLLGIGEEDQNDLIEKGYYLVVEPLIWTNVPFSQDNKWEQIYNANNGFYDYENGSFDKKYKFKMVMVYGTLSDLKKFDETPENNCIGKYQLFSGIRYTDNDNDKGEHSTARFTTAYFADVDEIVGAKKVEEWSLLYAMALSTSKDGTGKDVADLFADYIRWYGNDERFDNSSEESEKWYYAQYATDEYNKKDVNYTNFTSEEYIISQESIERLYQAILDADFYRIKCKTDILVEYVNGDYTVNSDVYTTVKVKNISGHTINIGNITSEFTADNYSLDIINSEGTNAFGTTYLENGQTACISIKWRTPSEPVTLNFNVQINQSGNDETAVIVSPQQFQVNVINSKYQEENISLDADNQGVWNVNKNIKEKYNSIYSADYCESMLNDNRIRWQNIYLDEEKSGYFSGSQITSAEFVKNNEIFHNSLNFSGSYPIKMNSYINGSEQIFSGDTIKSGYGVEFSLDYSEKDELMTYQTAKVILFYPEYGYDMQYASAADYSEFYNKYLIKSNPQSLYETDDEKSHVHFIPDWWPDDKEYKVYWVLADMWTPSGKMYAWGDISLNTKGSFYDDWYITRNTKN